MVATLTLHSEDPLQTEAFGAALGQLLLGGEVVALSGELGAGKTCFVRGIASGLGVDDTEISSPTFVICVIHHGSRLDLAHLDAWRLTSEEDLESIGFEELRSRDDLVCAVEWPERLGAALPTPAIRVTIHHGDTVRDDASVVERVSSAAEDDDERSSESASELRTIEVTADPAFIERFRRRTLADPCRTCGRETRIASRSAPFCSERCRLADLGAWFNESRRIAGGDEPSD